MQSFSSHFIGIILKHYSYTLHLSLLFPSNLFLSHLLCVSLLSLFFLFSVFSLFISYSIAHFAPFASYHTFSIIIFQISLPPFPFLSNKLSLLFPSRDFCIPYYPIQKQCSASINHCNRQH